MKEDQSMLRTLCSTGLVLSLALAPVTARGRVVGQQPPRAAHAAQAAQPAQAPKAEPPQPERRRTSILEGQPVNVRIEITITDQQPGSAPIQKTVMLVLADRTRGMARSESNQVGIGTVPLRTDARVSVVDSNKVLAEIAIDYNLPGNAAGGRIPSEPPPGPTDLTKETRVLEQLKTILESGKPLVVSESADPLTDRKVKVEVTATILK
jgi:hypothetical protein